MTKLSRNLSLELRNALTAQGIREWLRKAEEEVGTLSWLPVGGQRNNRSSCDMASGAMPALTERVTNGQDAVIDDRLSLEWLKGNTIKPGSPREAAKILLGIHDDMDSTPVGTIHKVANLLVVGMHEGSSPQTPTCVVRDKGIGQHPDNFHSTLLSISSDNKTDKPWMHGLYNVGSSACYKFAGATVIISRRNPELLDAAADEVGASIVLYEPSRRPGPCVYATDKDGNILRLDLPEFEPGTEIRLVDYQIAKYNAKAAHATNSLRQGCYAHFVRPSIPFCIAENRPRFQDRSGNQKIYGLYHALEGLLSVQKSVGLAKRPPICVHKTSHTIPIGKIGSVNLKCFVLHEDAKSNYYVSADQAFCFSLNGQRHYSKERSWFRGLGYNNIFQRIICVVECDKIDYDERHNIFTSNREGVVEDSPHFQLIMERVEQFLKNDPDLHQIEEEAKDKKIRNASGKVGEKTLDQIKRIIGGQNIRGTGTQGNHTGKRTPPSGKKRSTDDSHLPELPTKLEIEKDPFNASRGSILRLYVKLDCKNGYLPSDEREILLKTNFAEVLAVSGSIGGSVRFDIKVFEDAPVGEHEFFVMFRDKENDIFLCDSAKMNVKEPKAKEEEEQKKNKDHGNEDRNVNVLWVLRESWDIHGWDGNSVGECQEDQEGGITFFLNRNNIRIDEVAEKGDFTEDSWERFLERCSLPVSVGLYGILTDTTPKDPQREENEKRRILHTTLLSIRPELVPNNLEAPGKGHRIPALRNETHENQTRENPTEQRDVRNHGSFKAEMQKVMELHPNN